MNRSWREWTSRERLYCIEAVLFVRISASRRASRFGVAKSRFLRCHCKISAPHRLRDRRRRGALAGMDSSHITSTKPWAVSETVSRRGEDRNTSDIEMEALSPLYCRYRHVKYPRKGSSIGKPSLRPCLPLISRCRSGLPSLRNHCGFEGCFCRLWYK